MNHPFEHLAALNAHVLAVGMSIAIFAAVSILLASLLL